MNLFSRPAQLARLNLTRFSTCRTPIKLVLYTKPDCSLCDTAKEFIEDTYPNQFVIEEVDITKNNRELFRKFKLDIPVFYHEGTFLMQHCVDRNALEKLISSDSKENN